MLIAQCDESKEPILHVILRRKLYISQNISFREDGTGYCIFSMSIAGDHWSDCYFGPPNMGSVIKFIDTLHDRMNSSPSSITVYTVEAGRRAFTSAG